MLEQCGVMETTLMLLIVVAVFLVVEFPLAILFVILIVQNTFQVELIKTHFMNLWTRGVTSRNNAGPSSCRVKDKIV